MAEYAVVVCSVGRHEMAGVRGGEGGHERLAVAHFADDDDIGILAHDVNEGAFKLSVSRPTSRCSMTDCLSSNMYSIGSSRVMMWHFSVSLMCWTIAANVLDLPLPVGPVTRMMPRRAAILPVAPVDSAL